MLREKIVNTSESGKAQWGSTSTVRNKVRKIPMAWGTTTDRVTIEINLFPYAREIKHITLKDLETYLIPDG